MRWIAAFLLSSLISGGSLWAHHSFTNFWQTEEYVEVTGTVKALRLVNPHPLLLLEVTGEDGTTAEWTIIGRANVAALINEGWTPDVLPPGTRVTILGNPPRAAGGTGLAAGKITKSDGSFICFGVAPGGCESSLAQ